MFRRPLLRAMLIAAVLATAVTGAARADDAALDKNQKALAEVRSRIGDLQQKVEADQNEHDALAREMQTVERKIASATQAIRSIQRKLDEQQRKMRDTQADQKEALAALDAGRAGLARQIRAAYVLGRQGETQLLLNVDNAQTVGRMLTYYDYLQKAQLAAIAAIRAHAQELDELADRLQEQQSQLEQLRKDQQQTLSDLKDQRAQRADVLQQLKARLSGETDNLAQLKEDERNIRELIESLKKTLADLPPDVSPSDKPFATLKGKLPWPVRGALLAHYGEAKAGGRLSWNGHWIAAGDGAAVHAVAHGRVVYVGWMHRYGLIVLLEHEDGYFSLYGHCQTATVQVGDSVRAGQTIAGAGTTGGYDQSGVYFEIRKGADAIDPDRWLAH
ncbi:murein hydrolase activator EnvC family protein [Solimonas terrae]|uniref:Peptidoglycan DD-metalloendopeptidase family protein n=1 Tax=Solimonas terrae TaxID=1396819 RepID=A0A6M2BSF7_9GAMM|nr:peptidoglycan DD-metalloendopeptidase family protein [Solimonas terrae]NGY05526.1 peptidoglycan DD-metalloendopeptidase family protein [Solimonas terrae]